MLVSILELRNFMALMLRRRILVLIWVVVLLELTSSTVLAGITNGLIPLEIASVAGGMVPVIR